MLGAAGMLAAPSMTVARSGSPSMTVVRSLEATSRQSQTARLVPRFLTHCAQNCICASPYFLYFDLQISGEIPGASPDHHMMSPTGNIGKRASFPYVNHSRMFISHYGLLSLMFQFVVDV